MVIRSLRPSLVRASELPSIISSPSGELIIEGSSHHLFDSLDEIQNFATKW